MRSRKFIPYGHQSLDERDIRSVDGVLRSDWITQGPKVREFEEAVAQYCGANYAVACSSGTAALHLACLAAGLQPGDEVITAAMTFLSSANCALYVGATPLFADIDFSTMNVTHKTARKALTKRTRAIIPVHFAGLSCDMSDISNLAAKHKIFIIEDACHALGATYQGKKVGSCEYSDMAVLSFHPVKHITTGEGGMVLTNSKDLYERLQIFRNHGMTKDAKYLTRQEGSWYYEMHFLGYNYRITDFQCALGLSQLKKLDRFVARRRFLAARYHDALEAMEAHGILKRPLVFSPDESAWHIYVIRINFERVGKTRRETVAQLHKIGIGTQVHYIPVPSQPYYLKRFGYSMDDFPSAAMHYEQALTLPLFPSMTVRQVDCVVKALCEVLE